MAETPRHTYQALTKRSKRLARVADSLQWPSNLWMGVSIETQRYAFRADHLRDVGAAVRFISAEPLLGPLALDLSGIHWLIAGGESGPRARPMDPAWATSLRDQCLEVPVGFEVDRAGKFDTYHPASTGGRVFIYFVRGHLWMVKPTGYARTLRSDCVRSRGCRTPDSGSQWLSARARCVPRVGDMGMPRFGRQCTPDHRQPAVDNWDGISRPDRVEGCDQRTS